MLTPNDRTALAHLLDVIRSGKMPAGPTAESLGCSSCAEALRVLDGLLVPAKPAGVPVEQIAAKLCTVCRAPREPHETGYLKGDHEFVPPSSLADTEQAEVETQLWAWGTNQDRDGGSTAAQIVQWIRREGGEARFEPAMFGGGVTQTVPQPARIAILQADGTEDYAYAGDEVVKGDLWLDTTGHPERDLREFTVRHAADTDGAQT